MPAVLFVCTANICRSPIAMGIFADKAARTCPDQEWIVASAGTWAKAGRAAHEHSRLVLAQRGLDIESHRSQPVSAELLANFDLILTMEQGHKEALRIEFPDAAGRVFLISEMAGYAYDVPDPIGFPLADYEATYREIDRLLTMGWDRICQLLHVAPAP